MSRRLRPKNLSNSSSSIPDDLDYEKIDNKPRDDAVLAGCGATPRISLDGVAEGPAPQHGERRHRRAVSSFSFARKLQVDTAAPPAMTSHVTTAPNADDITSPEETHVLVDLEKALPPAPAEPHFTALPVRRAATRLDNRAKVDREIWRTLLLNMYPVTYLILWLPGIANRIAEGMGYQVRVLVILQSSTQFIGLANAAVYLYKEHRREVREWWHGVKGRKAAKAAGPENIRSDDGSGEVRHWRSVTP